MALLKRIHRELSKTLVKRGVVGTLKFGTALVAARLGELASHRRSSRKDPEERGGPGSFDERFGVQTAGIVHLGGLRIASTNWIHGLHYQPIVPPDFPSLLAPTGIDIPSASFIDLGSGKGRAILIASQLPFRRVLGIEFSEELNLIANRNLQRFPESERRCRDVAVFLEDAANFAFPEGPLVIYLYNPFEAPIMQQVIANLAAAYRASPRPVVVLYFTPLYADLWKGLAFLEQTIATDNLAVFVSRDPGLRPSASASVPDAAGV